MHKRSEGTSSSAASDVRNQEDDLVELAMMSVEVLDTDDEEVNPTFNLDSCMKSDSDHVVELFCDEWVSSLVRDMKPGGKQHIMMVGWQASSKATAFHREVVSPKLRPLKASLK